MQIDWDSIRDRTINMFQIFLLLVIFAISIPSESSELGMNNLSIVSKNGEVNYHLECTEPFWKMTETQIETSKELYCLERAHVMSYKNTKEVADVCELREYVGKSYVMSWSKKGRKWVGKYDSSRIEDICGNQNEISFAKGENGIQSFTRSSVKSPKRTLITPEHLKKMCDTIARSNISDDVTDAPLIQLKCSKFVYLN